LSENEGTEEASAQFQGGAGRIRNIHGIGPELVADQGGIGGIDLSMPDAGLFEPAQEGLEQACPKPALIDQAIKPAALAVVFRCDRQSLGDDRPHAVVPGEQRQFLRNHG
jgi:hypothetical protein